MTGRRKDTAKRERIAQLLRQGLQHKVIMERLSCGNDLIATVKKEMEAQR
jgi:hypothetical protein